jgi:hypothetical protein
MRIPLFESLIYPDPIPLRLLISWQRAGEVLKNRADGQALIDHFRDRALEHPDLAVRQTLARILEQNPILSSTPTAFFGAAVTIPLNVYVTMPSGDVGYQIKAHALRTASVAFNPAFLGIYALFVLSSDFVPRNSLEQALASGPVFFAKNWLQELCNSRGARPSSGTSPRPLQNNPQDQMTSWFVDEYVPEWKDRGIVPNARERERAARERFPDVRKRRELLRTIYHLHAPEHWKGRGRRKSAKN